jgi:FMN reductase
MNENYDLGKPLTIIGLGGTLRQRSRSRWALQYSLSVAKSEGVETQLLDLHQLQLPLFVPNKDLDDYPEQVHTFVEAIRRADGMLWSTGAYHGTLAGATKNALDYIEFLSDENYLEGVPIGLIAASGGQMAAVNAIDAMVHAAHALRAPVLPLKVPIGEASRAFSSTGELLDRKVERRLRMLAGLLVKTARQHRRTPALA